MASKPLRWSNGWGLLSMAVMAGCTHTVKVEPIRVEPIDITLHIYLEADKKLDAFFSDMEAPAKTPVGSGTETEGAKP